MTATTTVEKRENAVTRAERTRGGPVFTPNVDILEGRDELVLLADVPGAGPDDIDVQYEQGELSIHARVKPREPVVEDRCLLREYGVGEYHRSFQLGETIDNGNIHAEVNNGVLTVHLPKAEAAKPRRIAVKTA